MAKKTLKLDDFDLDSDLDFDFDIGDIDGQMNPDVRKTGSRSWMSSKVL
jgi:hypothetical protein